MTHLRIEILPANAHGALKIPSGCELTLISDHHHRHDITARARSSQKFGANVRRSPRAIKPQIIAAQIFNMIILAIPLNMFGTRMPVFSGSLVRALRSR